MRIVALAILFIVMSLIGMFELGGGYDDLMARTMVGFGFLIFTGLVAGELARLVSLPRITGYLAAGMICGPFALDLIDPDVIEQLKTVDDLALALIAFTAGGELHIKRIRRAAASIAAITLLQTAAAFIIIGLATFAATIFFPPFAELALPTLAALALFFGLVAAANSPATAVAVIVETKSRGAISEQVMSVTVLKDIVIVILAAVIITAGGLLLAPAEEVDLGLIAGELLAIPLSAIAGGIAAILIIAYLRYLRRELVLFVVAVSLLIVFASEYLHLHFLLVCMTAGFCVENFSPFGERLIKAIERTSMTVYIIFFAIAGASIDFSVMRSTWLIALSFVLLRMLAFYLGTGIAGTVTRQSVFARRHSWMGYLGQAGVSLGLASLVLRSFPEMGSLFYSIVVATIGINQVVGPIALKLLLTRAGETAESRIQEGYGIKHRGLRRY